MYSTNSKDEVIVKIIGKLSLELEGLDQLKTRTIIEEVLYNYDVSTRETALVASDMEDKIQMFLAVKKLDGLSEKTIKNYRYNLMIFANYLRKPLSAIDITDLRVFLANRCKNMKQTSTNGQITILKTFFSWLLDEEYILKNPAQKLKRTKEPKRLRHALTKKEVELIRMACVTDREKVLIEFAYSTGCRLSEIVGVNISDINWNERTLCVIGKGNKEREVCFDIKTEVLLQKYLNSRQDDNEALFVTSKKPCHRLGGRSIEKEISKIAKRAEIERAVFPHIFRHSFATHKLNSGVSINVVQSWLGHETAATTQIYAETSRENMINEYRRVS